MSEQHVCKVCGQLLADHFLVLRCGVAHTAILDSQGRARSCSDMESERMYYQGRIQALITIVRSLRWHAGRLRTKDGAWRCWELGRYASKKAAEVEGLERMAEENYSWSKAGES